MMDNSKNLGNQVWEVTYSEESNVADCKCQRNLYHGVIEYKPEPQHRYYSKSKTEAYTEPKKRISSNNLNLPPFWVEIKCTYAPRDAWAKNLTTAPQLKLQPFTILKNSWYTTIAVLKIEFWLF